MHLSLKSDACEFKNSDNSLLKVHIDSFFFRTDTCERIKRKSVGAKSGANGGRTHFSCITFTTCSRVLSCIRKFAPLQILSDHMYLITLLGSIKCTYSLSKFMQEYPHLIIRDECSKVIKCAFLTNYERFIERLHSPFILRTTEYSRIF